MKAEPLAAEVEPGVAGQSEVRLQSCTTVRRSLAGAGARSDCTARSGWQRGDKGPGHGAAKGSRLGWTVPDQNDGSDKERCSEADEEPWERRRMNNERKGRRRRCGDEAERRSVL